MTSTPHSIHCLQLQHGIIKSYLTGIINTRDNGQCYRVGNVCSFTRDKFSVLVTLTKIQVAHVICYTVKVLLETRQRLGVRASIKFNNTGSRPTYHSDIYGYRNHMDFCLQGSGDLRISRSQVDQTIARFFAVSWWSLMFWCLSGTWCEFVVGCLLLEVPARLIGTALLLGHIRYVS